MTQCERILEYFDEFGSITQLEAIRDLGCMRLASRISDLRQEGYLIERKMENGKNRFGETTSYARYYMEAKKDGTDAGKHND